MAPWVVVVCTTLAVALPLIVGWWYSEVKLRREIVAWQIRVDRLQRQVRTLNGDLARASLRASAVLKALAGEDCRDLGTSISGLHHALQVRTLALNSTQRRHAIVLKEVAELRHQVKSLVPRAEHSLSENQDFQLLLAQVTDERDRLRIALDTCGDKAQRDQMLRLREEVDELRFQLRAANRAIIELEKQLETSILEEGFANEITAPVLHLVSEKPVSR